MPDLIARLLTRPASFGLFQALHLLERAEPTRRPVGTSLGLDEAAGLSGPVSLGFPCSDVRAVVPGAQPGAPMVLSSPVMTLAGGQGPLPLPYTEMLLRAQREREEAPQAFLDIFQQRLLAFLYRGRCKHDVALWSGPLQQAPVMRALDALSGLGRAHGARAPQGQAAWLRHAGLQGAAPRSLAALLTLLRDRLDIAFTGHAFEGAWHPLAPEERARLASRRPAGGSALGQGAGLGARVWNPSAGIALATPALDPAQAESLLPGGAGHDLLAWLVARHQQQDTPLNLQLDLAGVPVTPVGGRLPSDAAATAPVMLPRLGLSAWLYGPQRAGHRAASPQCIRLRLRMQAKAHGH